ncbi:MAG: dodecin family protein [Nitrososphaerales archaeon]
MVYKYIEVVGVSQEGLDDAIKKAVKEAYKESKQISWFSVSEIRGSIKEGEVKEFQVTVKIGYKVS